ncbi:MAG: SpoVR family protein [Gammaproteobacteria bacterium]|nr:SpoVR family protein [Gammaproteobacteria bacterium]MBV9697932.1 SpoVR family protein [Gammaproteobacteria bacterium]
MSGEWHSYVRRIEELAVRSGLSFHPVDFEAVPDSFMMEIAVYGLPVRMPHWSFGVRYIYQLIQRHMGNSRLFEVVFPGNPGHAYLAESNGLAENILVTAHVLGHADFSRNNLLFRRCQEQVSERIVEHAAHHARQISQAIEAHGAQRVEATLDAALALEQHIDVDLALRRERFPEYLEPPKALVDDAFFKRFSALEPASGASEREARKRAPLPPHPERDLLWFIANYAPEMESWERDIFLAVREESFYFYPVFATQIMNEGWASYWHARLLREADFIPQQSYVDAIKCHSDVVRPIAAEQQVALSVNPYHLGFAMWEKIVETQGLEAARRIMVEDDDFGFVRNHLTRELAEELGLFRYSARSDGQIKVLAHELPALHEALLGPKYNFGAPVVLAKHVRTDGTLELLHDTSVDGRGLDLERSRKVLDYVHRVWRRPIVLTTVNQAGAPLELTAP